MVFVKYFVLFDYKDIDWVVVVEGFFGIFYLWGGCSSFGLDCLVFV